ncbi:MAG: hypothetical protein RQ824_05500, partial [bacterium]|nr:hypothetical protein [bacterium]
MDLKNIFESIPNNLDEEVFELLLQNENIKIERIISKGHRSPESGWYDQKKSEWVIVCRFKFQVHHLKRYRKLLGVSGSLGT